MRKLLIATLCALPLLAGVARARVWTVETIDSSGYAGQYSSLAIDTLGGLHVCYYDSLSQDLRHAYFNGSYWYYGAIDTAGDVGRYCAIAMSSDNLPRVSYFDSTNRALKYGVFNGTSWVLEVADPGPGVGQYTSLALDNTDHPSISYYDQANSSLKYAAKPAGTWNRTTLDNAGAVGRFSSIAIGEGTKPWISYYSDDLKQLRYAYLKNSNWKYENPDPAVNVGQYTAITVNAGDVAFVAYLDSANGRLKRATRNGGWTVDVADSSGFVGGFASIALDNAGNPVISYFDRTHGDLKLAAYTGSVWMKETVDTSGSVGLFTSCKVGRDSTVYIAYFGQTLGHLKLARTVPSDTTPPGSPLNLTADGSNPSPWSNDPRFGLNWTNPVDSSGIARALYKLGSAPAANYDTTGSLPGMPPDSVTATAGGGQTLYLWLVDSLGNTRYQNSASVVLRYDGSVPCVASTFPAAGDTAVAINSNVSATFSETMDPATMVPANFTVSGSSSGVHAHAVWYSDADSTVTLDPAVDFSFNELVTVTVRREVTDRAGNLMAADTAWTFRTGSLNDTLPPDPPQGLTANGSNPSPWSNDPRFSLDWTNPPDSSGIGRSLYKLGSAPMADDDTTGSLSGAPPDSVVVSAGGGQSLHLWLEDRSGNRRHQNAAWATLRYDGTAPAGSAASSPVYSAASAFTVNWTAGSDAGGSGLSGRFAVMVRDGAGPWTAWINDTTAFSAVYAGVDGHRYHFEAAAKDSAGNVEPFSAAPECSTLVDLTAPAVAATAPAAGDTAVSVGASIRATFSEPMDPVSMVPANFSVSGSASGNHTVTAVYVVTDSTVTLDPAVDLSFHETVTVTVRKEVADRAGNPMAADKVWTFLTGSLNDTVPPVVVRTVPDSAATGVAVNTWMRATFSEKLNPATVTSDKILVRGSVNGIYPFWSSYTGSDSTLSISAYSNFAAGESVNVYIAPGIEDLAGNAMTGMHWWWFRTGVVPDTSAPRVIALDLSPDTVWQAGAVLLTGRIGDDHAVFSAEYFLDSIGADGTGQPVAPADTFGAPTVDVSGTILTGSLNAGPHTVYLHGVDASGLWGTCDSAFFFKAGTDTIRPAFAIQLTPAAPAVGAILSVSVIPSEPLHPDSALTGTLRIADGSVRLEALSGSGLSYAGTVNTAGFAAGECRLTVTGYDRWSNRGASTVTFRLEASGEFLPADLVYVWPNPARGDKVNFHYYVNANAAVTAEVFTLDGRRIASLSGRGEGGRLPHQATSNAIVWDIAGVASDVYLLRLHATADAGGGQGTVVKKFAIVK